MSMTVAYHINNCMCVLRFKCSKTIDFELITLKMYVCSQSNEEKHKLIAAWWSWKCFESLNLVHSSPAIQCNNTRGDCYESLFTVDDNGKWCKEKIYLICGNFKSKLRAAPNHLIILSILGTRKKCKYLQKKELYAFLGNWSRIFKVKKNAWNSFGDICIFREKLSYFLYIFEPLEGNS